MQAVILVGGEGTRLRPLTYDLPKPMAPLLGRPFIGWIIERLRAAGVDEIILSCCYLPDLIEAHFGSGAGFGVRLHYVLEKQPLGTAGAIRHAAAYIKGPIYVCNGDILTGVDLKRMRALHEQHGAIATIHTRKVDDPSHFGVVETDGQGRVQRFVEKPAPGETDARDINAGTYILEPEVVAAIPPDRSVSIERETFPKLIQSTGRVYAMSTADYWIDVGRPQNYVQAHCDILDRRFEAPLGREVAPSVWSADDRIQPVPAQIVGPAYLGAGVVIHATARLEPYASLYDDCVVSADAHVGTSILWPRCRVGKGAVVRDAILGFDVEVADGVVVPPGSVVGRGQRVLTGTDETAARNGTTFTSREQQTSFRLRQ